MRRADIEREFDHDGGISSPDRASYTYKECHYVKVEVEFTTSAADSHPFAPDDQVSRISKPFLAYPISD